MFLLNVSNYSPNNKVSHPRRPEPSVMYITDGKQTKMHGELMACRLDITSQDWCRLQLS